MSPKKAAKPKRLARKIHGCDVVIVTDGDKERLLIDSKPFEFAKVNGGYVLKANVYTDAKDTLVDAVEAYLAQETSEN